MFRNYLVTALRNFSRHKLYSLINIAGLTVGLTSAIFIILLVRDEVSYDRWIPDAGNVYRVGGTWSLPGQKPFKGAGTPFPVPDTALAEIPEVKAAGHLEDYPMTVATGDRQFLDEARVVSPNFFQIIPLPLIQGDPARVFAQPESVVISESAARKYFGGAPALGKMLHVGGRCEFGDRGEKGCIVREAAMMVTGVMRDLPYNSQLSGDVFIPSTSNADPMSQKRKADWMSTHGWGYVKLQPHADPAHVTAELAAMVDRHLDPRTRINVDLKGSQVWTPFLTSFRDDHLSGDQYGGLTPAGSWAMVYGFSAVGALILLVACFNFTNLATAQATVRAREISLRKVLGARRGQLAAQFLGESVLITMISLALALSLTEVLLPFFDRMVGKPIALHYLSNWPLLLALMGLALATGLIAGAYPAAILSGFRPASALRTTGAAAQGSSLVRTSLVAIQFAVSIGLGIAALVVFEQTSFARGIDLGLDRDGMVVIAANSMTETTRQSLVRALDADPALKGATLSSDFPFTGSHSNDSVEVPGQPGAVQVGQLVVSPDFFSVYRIRLSSGRPLSESRAGDVAGADSAEFNVLINRAAAKQFGFTPQNALGKSVSIVRSANAVPPRQLLTIVGVTDDFKFKGDREDVLPTIYSDVPHETDFVSVRVPAGSVPQGLSAIDRIWHGFAPSIAIDRHFSDQDFDKLFAAQEKQESMFSLFVVIAIAIAAMGLFGLAAFSTERRTKEIGIRKSFGARSKDIVLMLLWQFSIPVLIANLIAWPVAYYYLRHWLEGYAYRISLNPLYFVGAGAAALVIAWATVFVHARRVAKANPIHALRYE